MGWELGNLGSTSGSILWGLAEQEHNIFFVSEVLITCQTLLAAYAVIFAACHY